MEKGDVQTDRLSVDFFWKQSDDAKVVLLWQRSKSADPVRMEKDLELMIGKGSINFDIGKGKCLRKLRAGKREVQRMADSAVRPIAAKDPFRLDFFFISIGMRDYRFIAMQTLQRNTSFDNPSEFNKILS